MKESGCINNWACEPCKRNITSKGNLTEENIILNRATPELAEAIEQMISDKLTAATNALIDKMTSNFKLEIEKLVRENKVLSREIAELKSEMKDLNRSCDKASTGNAAVGVTSDGDRPATSNNKPQKKQKHQKNPILNKIEKKKEVDDLTNININTTVFRNVQRKSGCMDTQDKSNDTDGTPEDGKEQQEQQFTEVTKRRRSSNKNKPIMGTGNGTSLRGVAPYKYFHICGLSPETTCDDVIGHLNDHKFLNVKCERLSSKRPDEYASFKVAVSLESSLAFSNPEIWPHGARINKYYFHLSRRTTNPS